MCDVYLLDTRGLWWQTGRRPATASARFVRSKLKAEDDAIMTDTRV